jgi:hypothetical protein
MTSCVLVTVVGACAAEDDAPQDESTSSSPSSSSSSDDAPDDSGSSDGATVTIGESSESSSSSSADSTESSTGGVCQSVIDGACGECLAQDCCAETSDCEAVPGCIGCIGGDPKACADEAAQAAADALLACPACDAACSGGELPAPYCEGDMEIPSAGSCVEIGRTFECNPVTQEPCDVEAGAACDVNVDLDGFSCYPSGNDHAVCETCSAADGFCQAGLGCPAAQMTQEGVGQCSKFCCDDSDCGPAGTCYLDFFATLGLPVGYCLPPE